MQNSKLKKEILGQHKEVSAKELELYNQGKLSADKAREVEMKLHSNEFSAAAIEGFDTYGSGVSATEVGKSYRTRNYRPLYYSIIALCMVASGFLLWPDSESANESRKASTTEETLVITELVKADITSPDMHEKLPVVSKEKRSSAPQPKVDISEPVLNEKIDVLPVLFSSKIEKEIFKPTPIQAKKADLNLYKKLAKPASKEVKLRHYKSYKLVDQGFGLDQSLLTPILQGTPASSEIVYQRPEYPEWVSADSVYRLTINKALDFIIDEKLNEAQFQLERLVELEERDITATFYLGYVYFLREDYAQAIDYFNRTETHIIQTFDHDSRFMEIKCLLALNRNEEAQKEVDFLVSSNSFYAEKAKELLAP